MATYDEIVNASEERIAQEKARKVEGKILIKKLADFLNQEGDAVYHLWMLLSALRGPDRDKTGDLKVLTTMKVRNSFGLVDRGYAMVGKEHPTNTDVEKASLIVSPEGHFDHFVTHFEKAVNAIKYYELDNPKKEETK